MELNAARWLGGHNVKRGWMEKEAAGEAGESLGLIAEEYSYSCKSKFDDANGGGRADDLDVGRKWSWVVGCFEHPR